MAKDRSLTRRLLRWSLRSTLIVVGLSLLLLLAFAWAARHEVKKSGLIGNEGTAGQIRSAHGGADFDRLVPARRQVKSLDDLPTAATIRLIPERQEQALPVVRLSDAELQPLAATVAGFLAAWQTFSPFDDPQEYRERIAPFADPDRLEDLANHVDDRRPRDVGVCDQCMTGATLDQSLVRPGDFVRVRMLDGERAFVTTQGVVRYAGTNPTVDGKSFRRSYGLLLVRDEASGAWLVQRAAAESLRAE